MRHATLLRSHLLGLFSLTLWATLRCTGAYAENNQVITVPFSQQNPNLPHPAHEGALVTLKGIIRNATCSIYRVSWDLDRDGDFEDEYQFTAGRTGNTSTVYDIGRSFVVPYFDRARPLNINVRVECGGAGGEASFGTYKLFVYNFGQDTSQIQHSDERLFGDPTLWTEEQFEVMTTMAIQEAMWHTHRHMAGYRFTNHKLEAHSNYAEATGVAQWLFVINNHLPAYPPSSVSASDATAEWRAVNTSRWESDPYAESAMRLLNYNVSRGEGVGISAEDESDHCGYRAGSGSPQLCTRIAGTNDGGGIYARDHNVYRTGMNTGAIATVLPALSGTKVRVGPGEGNSWEWYVQQLVDYLGYQQRDGGCAVGGWFYEAGDETECRNSDLSTTQWAYIGLESAEIAGRPYGVFVNNRHKYRIANNLVSNIQSDNGAAYDNRRHDRSDVKLTGGQLLGSRWLNAHNMNNSAAKPFPQESEHSYRQLRENHDAYYGFIQEWFTRRRVNGSHWQDGLWRNGDYLCGDNTSLYNVSDRCGNTYSLYSHQKAYHTGAPALHDVGHYDWYRMFTSYYVRAQYRYANNSNGRENYGDIGKIWDDYCEAHSVTCVYGPGHMSTIMGGLVMTPAVFNPKPIPIGSLVPILPGQQPVTDVTVTEGCVPGQGRVTVSHQESFHPNSDSQIRTYMWDMDASNGLWWETNPLRPDLDVNGDIMSTSDRFKNLTYVYQEARTENYQVTLRVEDNTNQYKQLRVGAVKVNPGQDVPPAVATGGPYVIDVGDDLRLRAAASDGNEACGDELTVEWDLDSDGVFEVEGANTRVNWSEGEGLGLLARNQPFNIRVRVTDSFGVVDSVIETTTLSIYTKEPETVTRANPTEAACRQEITFDGSGSYHNNPQRTISSYQWTVDGRTSDRAIFTTSFNSYGPRTARLVIQDDLGHESSGTVEVNVNLGNLPPVVRVVSDQLTLMSNEDLRLNASQSSDPNADCGDSIQQIGWYLHPPSVPPNLTAPPNFTGATPTIPIADWHAAMGWPNSDQLTVTVAVRDSFGALSTKDITVMAVRAEPIAVIAQIPNPSAYRVSDGTSSARIDGRESYSLLEGVSISRYEWDLDCDGSYERESGQFLYEKVFEPNTPPEALPPVMVCLRVTDSNGNVAVSEPYAVRYQPLGNTPPYADADPSDAPEVGYHVLQGQVLTLDASSSFDPDAEDFEDELVRYEWTLNGAQGPSLTLTSSEPNPAQLELSPAQLEGLGMGALGSYPISLTVVDKAGNTGADTSSVTIHKEASELIVVINPTNASPNSRVTFDASRSAHSHPDIDVSQVIWFFGALQVSGPLCDSDSDCDVGYCITNPSTDALTCMSSSLGTQEGSIVNQSFDEITPAPGDAIGVTVVVRDSNGGQTQSGVDDELSFDIRVDQGNRLPQANAGGGTALNGDEVLGAYTFVFVDPASPSYDPNDPVLTLDGARSVEPDARYGDEITSYTWHFGTCTCSSDLSLHGSCPLSSAQVGATLLNLTRDQLSQCGIQAQGQHSIALTVTDRFGESATSQAQLNVLEGLKALAQALPSRTSCEQQVTFDGRGSSANGPVDQGYNIVEYAWDLDGDGVNEFSNATFTTPIIALPDAQGESGVTARLTVTNAIGAALIAQGKDPGPHRATDDTRVIINIQQLPPSANPGGPYRTGGQQSGGFAPVTVDGRASSDSNAPCDGIAEYWWDTDGDGLYGPEDTDVNGQPSDYTGPVVTFSSSAWRANTTANVGLKVKDYFGQLSPPTIGEIIITDAVPPSGEIISPRAGDCASETGPNASVVDVTVRHPAETPQPVQVDIKLGAHLVQSVTIPSTSFNNPEQEARVQIPLDLTGVPEGDYNIIAVFKLTEGSTVSTQTTSGGAVSFDFTPPLITIGAQPAEGVCYANGRVNEADVEVVDNFDEAPLISQNTTENGCIRTLTVVARDRCGRESSSARSYRVALPVTATVTGITEGELQGQARANWELNGPAVCSNNISADLSRDGQAFGPYAEGSLISTPGEYRLRLSVLNCLGVAREQVTSFRINRPPVAVALPSGHPSADPEVVNGYIVSEGSALTLDGTSSLAPEDEDQVAAYLWTIPGQAPLTGPRPVVNTQNNGVFSSTLEVTDQFGDSHTESFTITVTDIHPIPHGGGPYVANQDVDLMFDASASRSISPADPITSVDWDWGDGTSTLGAPVHVPQAHRYSAQGAYNVKLTVHDEDSSAEVTVGVIIADVDPEINDIYVDQVMGELNEERPDPVIAYESVPITFGVDATPGSASDPITFYQWDFDGDNIFDVTTDVPYATWQFMEPEASHVGVLVRDRDSFTFRSQLVDVKPVNFQTTLTFARNSVQERINGGTLSPINRLRLAKTVASAEAGIWGQRRDELNVDPEYELEFDTDPERASRAHLQLQGISFSAAQRVLSDLVQAQTAGEDFGVEIWSLSRQLHRETDRDLRALKADAAERYRDRIGTTEYMRSVVNAESYSESVAQLYRSEAFEPDARRVPNTEGLALTLQNDARRAMDWMNIGVDQCAAPRYRSFQVQAPEVPLSVYLVEAEEMRILAHEALTDMLSEMDRYIDMGVQDPGPAREEIITAQAALQEIVNRAAFSIDPQCFSGETNRTDCSDNLNALELELEAMDLIEALRNANSKGAYVMHWQSCLVRYLRFRIKVSIAAVRVQCGLLSPHYLKANTVFNEGDALLSEDDIVGALNFYTDSAQRCFILDVYNQCLSRVDNVAPYEYPEVCLE